MGLEVSFTDARDDLTNYIARSIKNNEVIKIHHKINDVDHTVALIAENELESLIETVHLLSSPRNKERLYIAFERTENQVLQIASLKELCREMKLENIDN